jgi:uncharacterized caspase-like protein
VSATGSRLALIVANDSYDDPGLRRLGAPARDAEALATALGDPAIGGFEVAVLRNARAQELRLAVEDFFADRRTDDLLLLHFSCHGLKNAAGELFLAVADTRPTRLASTAVAADFVNRQMADSRAQRIVLFLDCCYGGAFPRGMVVRAAGEAQVRDAFAGQERVGGGRGRVVVTASRSMEYAFEGDQLAGDAAVAPSVFTGAVVEGLTSGEADRDGDGWVGLTELVGYVGDRVQRTTPHQNPQMWTFGSQGELLIARSRARRPVTPAALPPELAEAMDSPLTATRFGVVDDLRERLAEADLGQAYAALLALRRLTGDDSRKVSDAARHWLDGAVPGVPATLELVAGAGEFTVTGPPIALAAEAAAGQPWLAVEQDGALVRVRVAGPVTGADQGTVVVSGPSGEGTVRVRLASPAESATPPEPTTARAPITIPEPSTPPEPATAQDPAREPVTAVAPDAAPDAGPAPDDRPLPWWAVAVLLGLALVIVAVQWPPEGDVYLWSSPDEGWYVYRSLRDLIAPGLLLAAALGARLRREFLGVVIGAAGFLATAAVIYLLAGVAHEQRNRWLLVLAASAATIAVAWYAGRVRVPLRGAVDPGGAVLVAGGAVTLLLSTAIELSGNSWFTITNGMATIGAALLALVAWPLLGPARDAATRRPVAAAAVTVVVLDTISSIPALTSGQDASFYAGLAGRAAVLAGIAVAWWSRRSLRQP